jgi:hypothetical protein
VTALGRIWLSTIRWRSAAKSSINPNLHRSRGVVRPGSMRHKERIAAGGSDPAAEERRF